MDIQAAESLAKELMERYLPSGGWSFEWDNRKTTFGYCSPRRGVISLSLPLTAQREETKVRNTILHEIAHALTPGAHHNKRWRLVALSIGCDGTRCGDSEAEGVTIPGRFQLICPNGHFVYKHRKPKIRRSCAICYTKGFDERFLMTLHDTHAESPLAEAAERTTQ